MFVCLSLHAYIFLHVSLSESLLGVLHARYVCTCMSELLLGVLYAQADYMYVFYWCILLCVSSEPQVC